MSADPEAPAPVYLLRLVIAGSTARSVKAIANLQHICRTHLAERYEIEVIDIYQQPELAEKYQVIAAPTLIKLQPLPVRRVIGDLSQEDRVLHGLDIVSL